MSNRRYDDCALIFVEDHAPVADAKPHTVATFKALHIAMPGRRKLRLSIRPRTSGESFAH
jgi:hypothetical protein